MKNRVLIGCFISLVACLCVSSAWATAAKTKYPVVFVHGMMGFDKLVGLSYFSNSFGVFVGDPCDQFLETTCNRNIDKMQQAYAASVSPFQSSEFRGLELADEIEGYMTTVGAKGVNIIGHSQGGMDARKAAKLLYGRKGTQVVKTLISISSPHRGSSVAGSVLKKGESGFNAFVGWAASNLVNPAFYLKKGDYFAAMKAFVYDDWDPEDGEVTGAKAFNNNYPMDNTYINYYASIITSVQGNLSPILLGLGLVAPLDIDGDGWCGTKDENGDLLDCDGDGVAGNGDGDFEDGDDDGLVGLNSQQMGTRLTYKEGGWFTGSGFTEDASTGYVSNLNQPNKIQSTSYSSVMRQDHLDIVGVGYVPYLFTSGLDTMKFYAELINYIAQKEGES